MSTFLKRNFAALLIACFGLTFLLQSFTPEPKSLIGNTVADFALRNTDGKTLSLDDYPDAKGFIVIFTCNHCPFAKLYSERLNALNAKYKALHVPLLAINSMDTAAYIDESFAKMQERATADGFNFPYLLDAKQTVGKDFKADHTPHAFVIWKENTTWKIKYSGAIDDNGAEPDKVTEPYIDNAVNELLQGKEVSKPETLSVGCAIFYRK